MTVEHDLGQVHELALFVPTLNFLPLEDEQGRRVLLRGPNGTGKTYHLTRLAAARAVAGRGFHRTGRFVSPTKNHVQTVAGKYLHQWLAPHLHPSSYYIKGKGWNGGASAASRSIRLANGYVIELKSLEDRASTHEGARLDWVIMDEPPTPEHFSANRSRLLESKGQLLIGATMVQRPVTWLRNMVEGDEPSPTGGRTVHASGWVQYVAALRQRNCPWMTEADLAEWREMHATSPWDFEQRINGAWEGTTEGRRFVLFTDRNVSRAPLQGKGWHIALWMDHGEVIGHQICLLGAYRGTQVHVLREYRNEIATSPEQDARNIYDMLKAERIRLPAVDVGVGDINTAGKGYGGQLMNKVLEKEFLKLHNAETGGSRKSVLFKIKSANKQPGINDWGQRIVNHACHQGHLTIHPRCRHLLDTMKNWKGGTKQHSDDGELAHMAHGLGYGILEALRDQPTYSRLQFGW